MVTEQALTAAPAPADPLLERLNDLIHSRAEVFASPSTSYNASPDAPGKQIYEETLRVAKYLFDASLKVEPEALKALAALLTDMRGDSLSNKIETRSKASQRGAVAGDSKGKGKAITWQSNPIFRPTSLQELYIDDIAQSVDTDSSINDALVPSTSTASKTIVSQELELQTIWEQLELRNEKVLQIIREIVHDGDDPDDDQDDGEGFEDDDDDSEDEDEDEFGLEGDEDDEEMMNGLNDVEDEDEIDYEDGDFEDGTDEEEYEMEDDESMEDEDDDEPSTPNLSEPYFAKLRDASPDSSPAKVSNQKGKKKSKESTSTSFSKPETEADDGLFSLKDFTSQVLAGEDEMNRYIQSGKSKSINDLRRSGISGLEDLDDSDNEEIDYFAPVNDGCAAGDAGLGSEDDDEDEDDEEEDEEEGGIRPEDMRYNDFWEPPSKVYTKRRDDDYVPNGKSKGGKDFKAKQKGKVKQDIKSQSKEADEDTTVDQTENAKGKRRVSFHDQVKVQEIEPANGPQSNFAKLVRSVGTKEALRRLKEGEVEDDDDIEDDNEDEDEDDGEEMTEEEMQELLDGQYGSDDDPEDEEDEEEEEEEDDDDMSQASDESVNQGALTMRRLQKDLLAEDDDDSAVSSNGLTKKKKGQQSRYESRMAALSEQIAALEAENVAEREWTMRGEVNARARPQNSLLEEDLEFDQAAKVVPVVTEESSQTLEDLIKKRILEDRFDDVVRKSLVEAAAYIPSRVLDIKDTQNERSLAEIYADEFAAERRRENGEEAETPEIDAKLAKEHESIRVIFEDICTKLDSLSNAHFTPQAAQTTITTISNAPSISLESAMPAAVSAASGLAPEEIYAPDHRGTLTSKSEMTPSQKKAERAKARKARMNTQKVIDKYSSKSRNDKQAKERAMNSLIGKRGVTVVGKGKAAKSALTGKDRRERGAGPDTSELSGAQFKL